MEIASLIVAVGAVVFAALAWLEARGSHRQATRASDAAERSALAAERTAATDEASLEIDAQRLEREQEADLAAGAPRLELQRCLFNEHRSEFLLITRNVGAHSGVVRRVRVTSGSQAAEANQPVPPLTVLPSERQSLGITSDTFVPGEEVTVIVEFVNAVNEFEWRLSAELVRDGWDRSGWPQWRPRSATIIRLPEAGP